MIGTGDTWTRETILRWLHEDEPDRLAALYAHADTIRRDTVGDEVHLRGLVELSNHCGRNCHYCGLRRDNHRLRRYRLTADEIFGCAQTAARLGYGTLVMQSGEDFAIQASWLGELIRRIQGELGLAITLSLGEREAWELHLWRNAGANRYLLKFETSNQYIYAKVHPARLGGRGRFAILRDLRDMGYEVGSGAMVGLTGQTFDDMATDLELFRDLDFDMIGIGPYIPHEHTPMGQAPQMYRPQGGMQVPATAEMTYKAVAITRILCPATNLPSTTALRTLDPTSLARSLKCGANVLMPVLTPLHHRLLYEIYPGKAHLVEPEQASARLRTEIAAIGRVVASGPGASPRYVNRAATAPHKDTMPC